MAGPISISCWGDSITYYGYPAFLQDLMPDSTCYNYGVPGEGSAAIASRMVAATARYGDIHIFWVGVNDAWHQATIMAALEDMVAVLSHSRYLILMTVTGEGGYAPPAAPHMADLKAAIEALYPDNFFDIRSYLMSRGNGSVEDNADIAADTVPSSLRVDAIHPKTHMSRICAEQVFLWLSANQFIR